MKLLPDTPLLLWATGYSKRLSGAARKLFDDPDNEIYFSAASLWEIAIKSARGDDDFKVHPSWFRRKLLDNGYIELAITSEHVVAVYGLPPVHKDPFDRLLIAQATVEGILLLTVDRQLAKYPGPIRKV
jgi:PIN domain nuclease of toxin-antitoxin system